MSVVHGCVHVSVYSFYNGQHWSSLHNQAGIDCLQNLNTIPMHSIVKSLRVAQNHLWSSKIVSLSQNRSLSKFCFLFLLLFCFAGSTWVCLRWFALTFFFRFSPGVNDYIMTILKSQMYIDPPMAITKEKILHLMHYNQNIFLHHV